VFACRLSISKDLAVYVPDDGDDATRSPPPADSSMVQQLLTETYSVIGEPDGLYGTTASYDVDPSVRMKFYLHEEKWHRALATYNLQNAHSCPPNCLVQVEHFYGWLILTIYVFFSAYETLVYPM